MTERVFILALALAALVTIAAIFAPHLRQPTCFEDEVIVWTGEAHDRCVPIDDIQP